MADNRTVDQVRLILKAKKDDGTRCPCCDQYVKTYKRKLNSMMARCLIECFRLTAGGQFADVKDIQMRLRGLTAYPTSDFAKLAYWELIEEMPGNSTSKTRTSGKWRITDKGKDFVNGIVSVPSHAYVYNGAVEGFTTKYIYVQDALSDKFDYSQLMSS